MALLKRARNAQVLCASIITLTSALPAVAQMGQSELITPGQSELITPGSPDAYSTPNFIQGVNPGKGWMPGSSPVAKRFAKPQAPIPQQAQMQPMLDTGVGDEGDLSNTWQDVPKRARYAAPQQTMPTNTGAAFQTGTPQADWELPSAQSEVGLEEPPAWQTHPPDVPLRAVTPNRPAAKTAAKPGVKKPPAAMSSQLNGQVTQNSANVQQPVTQFNPDAGFSASSGATSYGGVNQMMSGQNSMSPMNMGQMSGMSGGMNQMGMGQTSGMSGGMNQMGMGQMNGMSGGMSQMGMGQMNGMSGGMSQMGSMGQMNGMSGGMSPMGNMGQMNGMSGGGGTGGFDPMQALMSGMGGGGNPLDAIGKAIGAASQMGLMGGGNSAGKGQPIVPQGYDPNSGTYGNPSGGYSQSGGGGYGTASGGGRQNFTQQRGPSFTQQVNKVPGVKTAKQMGKQVNRAVQRNVGRAVDTAARGAMMRTMWGGW